MTGRRRQDDPGARGLEVPRPEGLAGDPAAGSRDAAADVPGLAEPGRQGLDGEGARDGQRVSDRPADHDRPSRSGSATHSADRGAPSDPRYARISGLTSAAQSSSPMSALEVARGRVRSASSARTAPARPRSSTCSRASAGRRSGRSGSTERTSPARRRYRAHARSASAAPSRSRTSSRSCRSRENVRLAAQARARRDAAALAAGRLACSEAVEQADWALERVGLGESRRNAGRVALARRQAPARARDGARRRARAVMLLDEPMAGVTVEDVPRARRADPRGARRGEARRC